MPPILLALSIGTAYYIAGNALRPLEFVTTEVGAELILIDVPLEFEPVGVWAGD